MNDEQQRGRSPSAGHHAHLTHSASTSPHPQASFDNSYQHQQFFANSDSTFSPQFNSTFQPDQYLNPQATLLDYNQQFQTTGQSIDITQQNYFQTQVTNGAYLQQNENLSPGSSSSNLNVPSPYSVSSESTSFPNFDLDLSGQALDPSLLYAQQQQQQQQQQQKQQQQQQQQGFDSSSSLSLDPMAATQQNPTPPHLLQAGLRRSSQSPSPHTSPSFQQTSFNDQGSRPRSESLDPSSAAYPPPGYHGNDWATGRAFQTHRRSPSDTYSEISSHSAQASPFLEPSDGFDVSPMLHGQDPVLFPDALGLGQFTLSDPQLAQSHISPAHSPHMSPNLMPQPQQSVPEYIPLNNFGYSPDMPGQNVPTFDLFQNNAPEPFPQLSASNSPGDFGQADIMSPPEINIELAPPSRQLSFGPPPAASQDDTLSPPERNQSRNRERAKSDSFASGNSRPSTPNFSGRGRSPSLQPFKDGSGKDSLSPHDIRLPTSRSPSPSVSSVSGNRSRTSSMSSVPQRDYILDLANPDRSTSNGHDPKRVQKHPANFQCTLCPKKFTRAYNLRSHLRTHTDERPFVCTVCGKAFARQHDRKRHEGLHSGEKKFVCKGALSAGEQWGCGRRFARADALGRHFRSEAGRVCIKPLLDEEAAERQRQWQDNQAQQQMQNAQGFVSQAPMMQPQLHPILPAALLQTYPELAQIDWSLPSAPMADDPMEAYSGRSSFDASSGGEWDMSENEMGPYGSNQQANGGTQQQSMGLHNGMGNGWGGQPDYLSDFEGR